MRKLFHLDVIVRDDERAFLTRDGQFQELLGPGRYRRFDPQKRYAVQSHKVVGAEIDLNTALLLEKTQPNVAAENFEIVQTSANEVAIVSFDGQPKHIIPPVTTRAFWKTLTLVESEIVDTTENLKVAPTHRDKMNFATVGIVSHEIVQSHESGMLFIDGEYKDRLPPGAHTFWNVGREVRIRKVDMRLQPLEVTAQEILTKDRVAIRVTLTAFYQVFDPVKAEVEASDVSGTLYKLVQFAVREAVATRTLDDILAARDQLDQEVRTFVSKRAEDLGVMIGEIGIKDVILPGDVRALLNKVVEAERTAKANLIRRQEETAATRSLLNTSKLMENNPLLVRLKELEALEKLVEKVGRIDLHSGEGKGGFDALLTNLYALRDRDEK